MNILALVSAGHVAPEDNVLFTMQNIDPEHAGLIADWLCLATRGPVELRHIGFDAAGTITRDYPALQARVKEMVARQAAAHGSN